MARSTQKGKVRGNVLLTVVFVMMILIVFLMGTLGLAAAANRRAQNSYTHAQTQYTARGAAEAILATMQNKKEVALAVKELTKDKPGPINVSVNAADGTTGKNVYGDITAQIEWTDEKYFFDPITKAYERNDIIKITATSGLANEENTVSVYVKKLNYKGAVSAGGGGGGLVSTGNSSLEAGISVYGGTGINLEEPFRFSTVADSADKLDAADAIDFIGKNGAHFKYSYDTDASFSTNASQEVPYEAPFIVNGDYEFGGQNAYLIFPGFKTGMTFWGDLTLKNSPYIDSGSPLLYDFDGKKIDYRDVPYIYVEDKLTLTSSTNLGINTGAKGTKQIPLNIFCGSIESGANAPIIADVYTYDKAVSNSFTNTNTGSILYKWTYDLMNCTETKKAGYVSGNLYSKGSVSFANNFNDGNTVSTLSGKIGSAVADKTLVSGGVFVEDNLTITANDAEINGDVAVGGTFTVSGSLKIHGDLYYNGAKPDNVTLDTGKTVKPYASKFPQEMEKEYIFGFMDDPVDTTKRYQIVHTLQDTMEGVMDPYKNLVNVLPGDFNDKLDATQGSTPITQTVVDANDGVIDLYGNATLEGDFQFQDTTITVHPSEAEPMMWLLLDGVNVSNLNGKTFKIVLDDMDDRNGDGVEETYNKDYKLCILLKTGGTVSYNVGAPTYATVTRPRAFSSDASGKVYFITQYYEDLLSNPSEGFELGDFYTADTTKLAKRPNIYIYSTAAETDAADDQPCFKLDAEGSYPSIITGYIQAPYMHVWIGNAKPDAGGTALNGTFKNNILYNGYAVDKKYVRAVGSIIAATSTIQSSWTILHYPPDTGSPATPPDDDPCKIWSIIQYENY